jgi:predicted nucleotidyltransferase
MMISLKSEITKKILNYFFVNPDDGLYVNELSRKLNLDKRNLVKKLRELETAGLLKSTSRGNLKIYSIDRAFPFYNEYQKIILATVGLEDRLKKSLHSVPGVKEAYLFGSFGEGKQQAHSDIDLLVIGSHNILELQKRLIPLQNEIGREINAVNMDEREYLKRTKNKDPFLLNILAKKNIKLI